MQANSDRQLLTSRKREQAAWLDQALAEQPPATRAKVLDFALKFGVGADDSDFWMLIAAVGFLHTIIETAPQEWEGLLSGFTQTLNQWTTSNLAVLEALANKAETDATQATLIRELSHTLRVLTTLMQEQQQAWNKLGRTSTTAGPSLSDLREGLNHRLSALSSQIETISTNLNSNGNMPNTRQRRPLRNFENMTGNGLRNAFPIGNANSRSTRAVSVMVLTVLLGLQGFTSWRLWQGQQQQAQILQWLLLKANRAECLAGIQPAESAVCLGLE